jgi:hypothetical protein
MLILASNLSAIVIALIEGITRKATTFLRQSKPKSLQKAISVLILRFEDVWFHSVLLDLQDVSYTCDSASSNV